MFARRIILIAYVAIFLVSCISTTATPELRVQSADVANMSMEIKQSAHKVGSVAFSPDGRYVLTAQTNNEFASLWDVFNGREVRKLAAPINQHYYIATGTIGGLGVAFSPDGRYAATSGKEFKLWDMSTGSEKMTIPADADSSTGISFSSDGKYVVITQAPWSSSKSVKLILYEVETGKMIKEFNKAIPSHSLTFSPDGRYALSGSALLASKEGGKMTLWDVSTGDVIRTVTAHVGFHDMGGIFRIEFSPDGKHALSSGCFDGAVKLWDIPSLTEVRAFRHFPGSYGPHISFGAPDVVSVVAFSPDGKYALSGGTDGYIKIWDILTGAEVKSIKVNNGGIAGGIYFLSLSHDGRYVVPGGSDAATRIWDITTGKEIVAMISFDDGEWLVITPEGYYNSSEKGAQYLSVKVGHTSYGVDKFYDVFYRPDIVAARLKGEDIKELVSVKMSDVINNPPPAVEILSTPAETEQSKVKVCYQVKGAGGGIGEVRVFHNGKLIESDGYYKDLAKSSAGKKELFALNSRAIYEDMRSVSIKGKTETGTVTIKAKGEAFKDCKEIETVSGENEVSVTAFNADNTIQGYMQTIKFNSKIKPEEPHLYILSIGIDQYRESSVNLKYAVKDAKDLEEKLTKQSATLFKTQNIHYELLTDNKASKANIVEKIEELSKAVKPNDSFILFVAGHGVLLQNQYYMITHDYAGKVDNNSLISSNEIVEMSKKIKSLSQLFIFDTCHAGGVDTIVSGLYDARMSVLARKMGLHIYASANSIQAAQDGYQANGLFTYTLLDGLNNNKKADKNNDNIITVVGLGEYAKQTTTEISKKTGHSQTPLIINFGKDNPVYKLE